MSVSLSRSLVQEAAGGVTSITNLFTSCFLIAVLYSIGPLFESLPIVRHQTSQLFARVYHY